MTKSDDLQNDESTAGARAVPRRVLRRRTVVPTSALLVGAVVSASVAVQAGAASGGRTSARSGVARSAPQPAPTPPAGANAQPALTRSALATNATCGQTVSASLTLNGDLSCPSGTALTVTGTSVVLNLNGHTISGAQTAGADGVLMQGKSDTVENGLVIFFDVGVLVNGTTDTVSAVRTASSSHYGIWDSGTGTKITNSIATGNLFGIVEEGTGAVLSGDHELNNGIGLNGVGLYLGNAAATVTSNVADGNGNFGIDDSAPGSTLKANVANFNAQDGITVNVLSVIDGGGNTAKGNDTATGATPEECFGIVCS